MTQFFWTDDLHTDNSLMDGDHRRLIDLLNVLFQTLENSQANELMSKAMNNLVMFAREHFDREEAEMERIKYVASLAHQSEHAKLIQQLGGLKQMLDTGGKINVPAVADFLGEWLRHHILAADIKLAAALKRASSAAPEPEFH